MKKLVAASGVIFLVLSLTSCGSNDQASAIRSACKMAAAKNYDGLQIAFEDIAAHDPGYLQAAVGANTFAAYKGDIGAAYSQPQLGERPGFTNESLRIFSALCSTYVQGKRN